MFCLIIVLHFRVFSAPGGPWRSLVGPSDVLGSAWGAPGASLWALGTSLELLGGSMGTPWRSLAALGISLGHLEAFFEVPGGSVATLWGTKCPRCYAQRCFSVSCVSLISFNILKFSFAFPSCFVFFNIFQNSSFEQMHLGKPWGSLGHAWGDPGGSLGRPSSLYASRLVVSALSLGVFGVVL